MSYPVLQNLPLFNGLDGLPLNNGKVYFGAENQNPVTSPINVYWDEAATQPAAQPLKVLNGYIYHNNNISNCYVNSNFSMAWYDENDNFISRVESSPAINFTQSVLSGDDGADFIGYTPINTTPKIRTVQARLNYDVRIIDFDGIDPTGVTDSTDGFQSAIDWSIANSRRSLMTVPGIYKISSTLNLNTSNNQISIIGDLFKTHQAGSTYPSHVINWVGGAEEVFNITGGFFRIGGFSVINSSNATNFLIANSGQEYEFMNLDFVIASGTNSFSESIFKSESNNFGYSKWRDINFTGQAPKFLYINGNGASNGITPLRFYNCHFTSLAVDDVALISLEDTNCDLISMSGCTFDQQNNKELCILDTTLCTLDDSLTAFHFFDNEIDSNSTTSSHLFFKFNNVRNIDIHSNQIYGGGSINYCASLTNSHVTSFHSNSVQSATRVFNVTDSLSSVNAGDNRFYTSVSQIYNDDAAQSGVYTLTWGATVLILPNKFASNVHGVFRIVVTSSSSWLLSFANPGESSGGYFVRGQIVSVQILNSSGGALSSPTLSTNIKMAGSITMPANGFNRTFTFFWDGSHMVEMHRTSADVAN